MKYYPSNIVGKKIVNALNGKTYESLVGSKDEVNFYRVIDSTGNYDSNGRRHNGHRTPNKLFFDNEEQYLEYTKLVNNITKSKKSKKAKFIKEIMNNFD